MSSSSIYKQQFSELSSQEVRVIREGVNFSDHVQEIESDEIDGLIEGVDFSGSVRDGETSSVSSYCDDFYNKTEQFSKLDSYYSTYQTREIPNSLHLWNKVSPLVWATILQDDKRSLVTTLNAKCIPQKSLKPLSMILSSQIIETGFTRK